MILSVIITIIEYFSVMIIEIMQNIKEYLYDDYHQEFVFVNTTSNSDTAPTNLVISSTNRGLRDSWICEWICEFVNSEFVNLQARELWIIHEFVHVHDNTANKSFKNDLHWGPCNKLVINDQLNILLADTIMWFALW